jgi:hypothetical protein
MQTIRTGRFGPIRSIIRRDESEGSDLEPQGTTKSGIVAEREFAFASNSLPDDELPFIAKELILERGQRFKLATGTAGDKKPTQSNEYWIVIDNVVYDCSEFAADHPGGESVILSFIGEDCSWQFWRLHSKSVMEQYGRELRIGRTEGIKNRFPESVRYVGLSNLGDDGW